MRVLVVDDEIELVSALTERLNLRGIDASYVTSGEAALEAVRNRHFDLALLDVKMPGLAGLELKDKLHELRPKMKFVFLTGYSSDTVYEDICNDPGVCKCLVKPVEIDELMSCMQRIFRQQKKES